MSQSPWRLRARRVIAEVLASLPADTNGAQLRAALREAYPFGPRAGHPYKCWLAEVRRALPDHNKRKSQANSGTPVVAYKILRKLSQNDTWLDVDCPWCAGKIPGGCMPCVAHHREVRRVVALATFAQSRACCRAGDELARLGLGDFLEEELSDRCGL